MSTGEQSVRNSPVPIFILGSGRSGTTVTASLMNRLPGVHIAKETGFIGQSVDLLRDIANPESRRRLVEVVNSWLVVEKWSGRASEQGFEDFCQQHQLSGASAFIHYVWQIDSPIPWEHLSYIGDNTPLYVLSIPWLLELFPDAKFVHVVRDPRDVVCSVMSMRFGADDPIVAAMEWQHALGCWLMAERAITAGSRIEFRYEDLCESPKFILQRLIVFLGTQISNSNLNELLASIIDSPLSETFRNVSELSHHQKLTAPLNCSRTGRYKRELTSDEIRTIEAIVQNGMLSLGYKPENWQVSPWARQDRLFFTRQMVLNLVKRGLKRLTRQS